MTVTQRSDNQVDTTIGGVETKLVKTIVYDENGSLSDGSYAVQFAENSGDSDIEYYGQAVIGSATSSAVWQIKKIDNTTGVVITWADSNSDFDNIYDNREALTYG